MHEYVRERERENTRSINIIYELLTFKTTNWGYQRS